MDGSDLGLTCARIHDRTDGGRKHYRQAEGTGHSYGSYKREWIRQAKMYMSLKCKTRSIHCIFSKKESVHTLIVNRIKIILYMGIHLGQYYSLTHSIIDGLVRHFKAHVQNIKAT